VININLYEENANNKFNNVDMQSDIKKKNLKMLQMDVIVIFIVKVI